MRQIKSMRTDLEEGILSRHTLISPKTYKLAKNQKSSMNLFVNKTFSLLAVLLLYLKWYKMQ